MTERGIDYVKCKSYSGKETKFAGGYNAAELMVNRDSLIEDCGMVLQMMCDTKEIDERIAELEREIEVVEGLAMQAINENKRKVINQDEWMERNGQYIKRHETVTQELKALDEEREKRLNKAKIITLFIKSINTGQQAITEFDEDFWSAVVDCVIVGVDGRLTFRFKNGAEIVV